jgi:hypothetical protein
MSPRSGSQSIPAPGRNRRVNRPRAEAEEEDGRGDEADRHAPLEERGQVGLRRDPRHATPEGHGEENDVHAVVRHPEDREESAGEEHFPTVPEGLSGEEEEREHAAQADLGGEGDAEPSGEGSGELTVEGKVSQTESEVDHQRPARDLSHRR